MGNICGKAEANPSPPGRVLGSTPAPKTTSSVPNKVGGPPRTLGGGSGNNGNGEPGRGGPSSGGDPGDARRRAAEAAEARAKAANKGGKLSAQLNAQKKRNTQYLAHGDAGSTALHDPKSALQQYLSSEDPLASQHELARAYRDNRQVKQATVLLRHVVDVETRILPKDDPERLASQHELALTYQANVQVKRGNPASPLRRRGGMEMAIRAEHNPDRLASQHELASAYEANCQISEGITLLEHGVEVQGRIFAEDHPVSTRLE
ncbi:hypothetical protein O9K51_00648 [Purpureocillium lavendulum]|uniref:Uncharacterized protein n=1 Tax=Purpureocillium lavendulum TaxID=1247861 RepID=A0AB34G3Q3_9HYPO|nr:hypothetical protein O9K51_00648 [Purpureocillium lavendulum]